MNNISKVESAWTPGPWQVHHNIGRKSETGIVADKAPCIVAIMGNAKQWPVEAEANARLISAAPDLFEALQTLVRRIERDNLHTTAGIYTTLAREALEKAGAL